MFMEMISVQRRPTTSLLQNKLRDIISKLFANHNPLHPNRSKKKRKHKNGTVHNHRRSSKQYKNEISELNDIVTALNAEKERMATEQDNFVIEKKKLTTTVVQQQEKMAQQQEQIKELQAEIQKGEETRRQIAENLKVQQKLDAERSRADHSDYAPDEPETEIKAENQRMKEEIKGLNRTLSEKQLEMRELRDERQQDQETMITMTNEKGSIQQQYRQLNSEKDELIAERDRLRAAKEELAATVRQQQNTVAFLTEGKDREEQLRRELEEEKEELSAECQRQREMVETLKAESTRKEELEAMEEQNEKLRAEIESMRSESDKMREQMVAVDIMQSEKDEIEQRYESVVSEKEEMERELQQNREQIQVKEQVIAKLEQQQREMRKQQMQRAESIRELDPKEVEANIEELKQAKSTIMDLKGQLQRMAVGQGVETSFIKEEEFANDKMSKLRQQTLKNLHDDIVEELSDKYEDLEGDEDSDSNDDSKENGDGELETKSKFELLMDRVASEFLFGVLMESMKAMKVRKSKICQMIARQLHVEDNDDQTAEQVVATMIHPQLQEQWEFYFKSKMENQYQIDISDIDTVVDGLYNLSVSEEPYSSWKFLNENKLKKYIKECAEICWIMILMKPELSFHPAAFRAIYEDKKKDHRYDEKEKHDLWEGSKTKNGAKIIYFSVPAISQRHLVDKEKSLQVLPGQLFAHNDESVVKYIMSDPDELMRRKDTSPDTAPDEPM